MSAANCVEHGLGFTTREASDKHFLDKHSEHNFRHGDPVVLNDKAPEGYRGATGKVGGSIMGNPIVEFDDGRHPESFSAAQLSYRVAITAPALGAIITGLQAEIAMLKEISRGSRGPNEFELGRASGIEFALRKLGVQL